jgi:metal-responsive CopG/Arc/MetJ family transcriptional regulator
MIESMKEAGPRSRRVTVSLPADLFERGEDERRKHHERRSEFVARLYRRYLQEIDEQERVARYAAAYAKLPETPEERWLVDQSISALTTDAET